MASPPPAPASSLNDPEIPPDRTHPLLWVPTLYFAMGLPNIAVSVVAAIMFKNLGLSNTDIAIYTGSMYLPWVIKPLWAPLVEMFSTKKRFVLVMEIAMMVTLGCVAVALPLPRYVPITLAFLWITGFASATQDIAADGVYIGSCSRREQALYGGVQGMCWNAGRVIAAGILVTLTGVLHGSMRLDWVHSWMIVMLMMAAIMGVSAAWHGKTLPSGGTARDAPEDLAGAARTFADAFVTFFRRPGIGRMIAFVLSYRLGEGLIEKMGPLFMLDGRRTGGLGLDNIALGHINGTFGSIGFIVGANLGSAFAAKFGLRRTLLVLCLALNVPHVTYLYLSQVLPGNISLITTIVTIEKFGFGFGSVGHMLYMMQEMAPGRYRTAHYAFATGFMALTQMVTGMISGTIQQAVGYQSFFVVVMLVSVIPVIMSWRAPFGGSGGDAEGRAPPRSRDEPGSVPAAPEQPVVGATASGALALP